MGELKTQPCGAVHPDGVVCCLNVMAEPGCCFQKIYEHPGPHEYVNKEGVITHRWEAVLVVKDLPYNAYLPEEGEDKEPEEREAKNGRKPDPAR